MDRKNSTLDKNYALTSKAFRNEVKLSPDYVDFYYSGNELYNHFYSDKERKLFYDNWYKNMM